MTAVRIDVPEGVASPVWLALLARTALQRALADPRSLQVETEGAAPDAAQGLSTEQRGQQAKDPARPASALNAEGAL